MIGLLFTRLAPAVLAVVILAGAGFSAGPARAQDADSSDLVIRLERLQNQMRQLTGQIEQLQYRNQQLEQQMKRMQEDNEFRFQQLGAKGGSSGGTHRRTGRRAARRTSRAGSAGPPLRCVRSVATAQCARCVAAARRRRGGRWRAADCCG